MEGREEFAVSLNASLHALGLAFGQMDDPDSKDYDEVSDIAMKETKAADAEIEVMSSDFDEAREQGSNSKRAAENIGSIIP